tara:strand:+ start:869 stop:1165 length:297 start_codon:yes stop_codon:yes gene_type:complete
MRLQDLDKFFSQKDKYKHMAFILYKIFEKILDCLLVFSISYWKSIVFMVKKDHSQVNGGDFLICHELVPTEVISLPEEVEGDDFLPTTHSCPNCGYEY